MPTLKYTYQKKTSFQQLGREAKDAHVHSSAHPNTLQKPHDIQNQTMPSNGKAKGAFKVLNAKAMRQEIEIALESMNGDTFRGTLSRQEV
jgi:hypothetical protein